MKYTIDWSELAISDADHYEIWLAGETSNQFAEQKSEELIARVASLADLPKRGTPLPELGSDIRKIKFGARVLVIYRIDDHVVTILRVIDGAILTGELPLK